MSADEKPAFYRDRFTPAQRRRTEALILVKRLWPHATEETSRTVASWIIRGEAKVKP